MSHDAEKRRLVEQACVDFEQDLKAFVLGILRDGHHADDVFQRTVVQAIQSADHVQVESVRGWLFRIALNEARMLKRRDARQGRLRRSAWEVAEAHRSLSPEGLTAAMSSENAAAVNQALQSLPDNYKAVVERRIKQNMSFADIADEINKPLGTVLTWMRRALAQLRDNKTLENL